MEMSWWFKIVRKVTKERVDENGESKSPVTALKLEFDHQSNRLEKERCNSARMGLIQVVEAGPLSESYNLYTTPSIDGNRVVLYNEQGQTTVARSSLFWNGDYLWTHKVQSVDVSPFAAALAPLVAVA